MNYGKCNWAKTKTIVKYIEGFIYVREANYLSYINYLTIDSWYTQNKNLHMVFVDLEKAYDKVSKDHM